MSDKHDLFKRRQSHRKDALFTEVHVLTSIHNLLITYGAAAWEITQTDLAEYLNIGERTLQRVTKRLQEMGRLSRSAGQGQSSYIYSIPPDAIQEMLNDVFAKSNLYMIRTENGCIALVKDFEAYCQLVFAHKHAEN